MNLSILFLATVLAAETPQANLVLRNGHIYTAVGDKAPVGAVAVRDGRVTVVGTSADVASWIGPQTRVIDLNGAVVVPGIQESHGHLMSLGLAKLGVDLNAAKSCQQIVQRVAAAAKDRQKGQWIQGRGWHESKWSRKPPVVVRNFPTHAALSAAIPDNPVVLERADGHAVHRQRRGARPHGHHEGHAVARGGRDHPRRRGEATGVFVDNAMDLIEVPAARQGAAEQGPGPRLRGAEPQGHHPLPRRGREPGDHGASRRAG